MNRAATAHSRNRKPVSGHVMLRRLATSIANNRLRVSQLMLAISLVVLATSASADTVSYEFVPGESEFVLMGGFVFLDETYTIEGSLGLDVDFDANVASFVDVDATLMNPSGIRHGASLDSLLNMTGAAGTVVDATTLTFTSVDDQGFTVSLDVSLMPTSLALVGANVPECCDRYSYQIDAVAVPEPATILLCMGAVTALLLCRRRRHPNAQYPGRLVSGSHCKDRKGSLMFRPAPRLLPGRC